jgi:biotin carboxyl carrier protein
MIQREKSLACSLRAPLSLLALALFCFSFLTSCKSDYPASARQSSPGKQPVRQVKTTSVVEAPFGESVTANGTLAAFDQTTVSVKVPGRLKTIFVDLGSVVSQGQVIAQVEPEDYKLRVQQAEASLAQARARLGLAPDGVDDNVDPEKTATVRQARAVLDEARFNRDRAQKLVEQGIIAKAEFDTANATFKVAEGRYQDAYEEIRNRQGVLAQRRSELGLARQQLKDTAVMAPINGIVQEKRASAGEYLAAGAAVVSVVRMDPLRLRAEIPERESHMIHPLLHSQGLQFAMAVGNANRADVVPFGKEQLQDHLPIILQPGRVGLNRHPLGDLQSAGGLKLVAPVNLNQAKAAGPNVFDTFQVAQGRNLGPGVLGRVEHGLPFHRADLLPVNC